MAPWPGYFISFEGLDGAGKSTQVASLAGTLRVTKRDVLTVRPNNTLLGEILHAFVLQHQRGPAVEPWAEALLFNAERVQLLHEVILPALQRGAIVIADRYTDSTLAYQGGGRGLPIDQLLELHRIPYLPLESVSMQERVRAVEFVLDKCGLRTQEPKARRHPSSEKVNCFVALRYVPHRRRCSKCWRNVGSGLLPADNDPLPPERLFVCTPTRLLTWLDCPRRYRMTYVDRPAPRKGPPWAHSSFGRKGLVR